MSNDIAPIYKGVFLGALKFSDESSDVVTIKRIRVIAEVNRQWDFNNAGGKYTNSYLCVDEDTKRVGMIYCKDLCGEHVTFKMDWEILLDSQNK